MPEISVLTEWNEDAGGGYFAHISEHLQSAPDRPEILGESVRGVMLDAVPKELDGFYNILGGYVRASHVTVLPFSETQWLLGVNGAETANVFDKPDIASAVVGTIPAPVWYWEIDEGWLKQTDAPKHPNINSIDLGRDGAAPLYDSTAEDAKQVGMLYGASSCECITSVEKVEDHDLVVWRAFVARPSDIDKIDECPYCDVIEIVEESGG